MDIRLSEHFTYKKLIRFTLPTMAMMIFTSIYSVVDGFFVSNFAGKNPFAAVNLIMPVLMIIGTVGFMFGTGGTALVAKVYGEGKTDKANQYFSLLIYTAFILGIILSILGFIFIKPIAIALGAEGELLSNCVIYARISFFSMPFFILQVMFQSFFVAAEKPRLGLVVILISGGTNIVLDAVLVTLLPQDLKLAGAAIATATAELLGGSIPLLYFFRKNSSILRLGRTSFDSKVLTRACINGSSEFMSNISLSIVGILYNLQLMKYIGENGIAAYGVMMYVSMIFCGIFFGYTIGVGPIISYNLGAKNNAELKGMLRKSLTLVGAIGAGMLVLAEIFAGILSGIFVGYDESLYELTVSGFRIFALAFGFMGFGVFASGFFTALNDGLTSALISFLRSLVFQTSSIMILPLIWGVNGIWISVVAAELMSVILGTVFIIIKRKRYNY